MYAFVDQPVDRLSPRSAFLLWAMRGWIHAATKGLCPPGQLAAGFAGVGALPALPPVHRLLALLNRHAHGELGLAPLGFGRVTEDEALLLQLWEDGRVAPARARATLDLLMDPEAVAEATELLLTGAARLAGAGLDRAEGARDAG
jgi:hypothetical protein